MHLDEGESKTSMEARQEKKEREKKMMEELQEKKKEFLAGLNFSHCRSLGQHCLGVVHDSDTVRTEPEQHQDYDQFLVAR